MNVSTEVSKEKKLSVKDFVLKYNAILMLVVLIIVSAILSPVFLSWVNITNLLRQNTPLLMVSIGMLLVVLTGGIDLSVGSVAGTCAMMLAVAVELWQWNSGFGLIMSIVFTLLVGFAFGSMTGFFVSLLNMAPFVASLAVMTIGRGVAYLVTNGQPIRMQATATGTKIMAEFGSGSLFGVLPWPIVLGIIVFIIFLLIARYTIFGRLVIATGSNESAVRLAGIRVKKYKFFAYAINGLLCGIAGIIVTSRQVIGTPSAGTGYELDAIAACVIGGASLSGGKGSVGNTLIGVLVLGLITNIMNLLSVAAYPQQIIKGVIILFAVLLQGFTSDKGNKM